MRAIRTVTPFPKQNWRILRLHEAGLSALQIADRLDELGYDYGLRGDVAARVRTLLRKRGLLPRSDLPPSKRPWKTHTKNHPPDLGDLWIE